MRQVQTDNSYFRAKVALRKEALASIGKKEVKVLDCFYGQGLIWKAIRNEVDIDISVLGIEIKKGKSMDCVIEGDNLKVLPTLDLDCYDLIDLDAYGSPFKQLEIIFNKNYKGVIVCTYIQASYGVLHNGMLEILGYNLDMIRKIPTLFSRHPMEKFKSYLSMRGVKRIIVKHYKNKHYLYFTI